MTDRATHSPSSARSVPLASAWQVIAVASIVLSLSMGLRQSLGLFLRPMTTDLGISAAAFGFALALQNLVWGLSQPFIGASGTALDQGRCWSDPLSCTRQAYCSWRLGSRCLA